MKGAISEVTGSPLRVLHVTQLEASNYYLNNLARYVSPDEVRLSAVTLGPDGPFCRDLRALGVECGALGGRGRSSYPRALFALWKLVRRQRIDILHLHLFEPTLLGLLVATLTGRAVITTRHHSDAVHRLPPGPKRRIYLALEAWVSRRARRIIAPSRRVKEVLTALEGVSSDKITVIPYGQTPDRFDSVRDQDQSALRRQEGLGTPLLVCVSRLHPEKGHPILFEAFSRLRRDFPDATLALVGTGPDRETLGAQVRTLGLEKAVRFLGWREDALRVLWSADLVVHPSLQEALPSAVIEAIMLGRPTVASDVSGVRDVLGQDGEYGFIVPPGDADALEQAMKRALEDLPEARRRADLGRSHVEQYMAAPRVASEYVACYRSLATEPR